jgi:hypothetical protein
MLSRETISAARSSSDADGSQIFHVLWLPTLHHGVGGSDVPPSTQSPEGVCVMSPDVASNRSVCSGSAVLHVFVDTDEPTLLAVAARHVAGV